MPINARNPLKIAETTTKDSPKFRIFPKIHEKYFRGNTCAWCAPGGFQCYADGITGPDSKDGSRCQDREYSRIIEFIENILTFYFFRKKSEILHQCPG